jgi:hypothetical protein
VTTTPVADVPSSQPPTRENRTDTTSALAPEAHAPSGLAPIIAIKPPKPKSRPAVKTSPRPAASAPAPQTITAPGVADDAARVDEESPSWEKLAGDTDDLTARVDTAPGLRRRPPSATVRTGRVASPLPLTERKWFLWAVCGAAVGSVLLFLLIWWLVTPARRTSSVGPAPRGSVASIAVPGSAANPAVPENRGL